MGFEENGKKKSLKVLILIVLSLFLIGSFFLANNFKNQKIIYTFEDDVDVDSSINSYMEGSDLIIRYNSLEEDIWIDGLPLDRYSIDKKKIVIYDYNNEFFKLHIGEESDIYTFGTNSRTVSDKYKVSFEFSKNSIIEKCLDIEIQNLQDSSDNLDLKTIVNETNFDINQANNIQFYEWKSEEVLKNTYEEVCNPYDETGINGTYQVENCSQIVNGSYTEEVFDWKNKQLTFTDKEGKTELRNTWEQVSIQKAGNKDTVKFRLCFNVPIVETNGWGNKGTIYLDLNGELFVDKTNSSWWNTDWTYKKPITFEGTINENWTQELTFDKPANMNSNCSDIRFLDSTETSEVGHRNVLCNSTTVIEHIKMNNNDSVYLYYGNTEVESNDDWRSTYQCGDDFNDYTGVPTNITEIQQAGTPTMNVTGGELIVTKVDGDATDHPAWLCDNWINYENYTYYDKGKVSVHDIQSPLVRWSSNTVGWALVRNMGANILNALHFTTFDGALDYNTNTAYDTADNVFYNHTLVVNGTTYIATYKQSVSGADSITWSITSATGWASSSKVGAESSNSGYGTWDWYYVMPRQSNMPTYNFGAEETGDITHPIFSNYVSNPVNNTAYSFGANYYFNVTITQTNGTAGLDFNSINYTSFNSTGTIFNSTISDLPSGTHSYFWWAYGNGTNELYNTSELRYYTIAKESSVVYTYLNHSRSNITIQNNTAIWLNSSLITGDSGATLTLYNNGTIINSGTSTLSNLTAFNATGMFNITTIYTASQNYTIGSETWWVNVTALDTINPSVTINTPLNQTYNTNSILFNITSTDETLMDSCWYSLNSGIDNITMTNISSEYMDTNSSMNQGSHIVNFYCNDSSNNVNDSEVEYFFIDSINPSVTLLTESPSDPAIYSFGGTYKFNATITDTNLQTVLIEFDGVNYTPSNVVGDVYNFSISDLSVGTYNYYWYANDSVGNTNSSESGSYTINKATPNGTLAGTSPITYGTTGNVEGTETNNGDEDLIYQLYREGTLVSNPDNSILGVGTYNYIYNVTSGQNYTAVTSLDTFALTIDIETGDGTLLLNGSATNYTINRTENVNITATLDTGSGDISVYIDTTLFQTGSSPISDQEQFNTLGWYLINFTYPGNENYTGFEKYLYVNVTANPLAVVSIVYPITGDYEAHFTQLNYTVLYGINCWYDLGEGGGYVVITCGDNVSGITSVDDSNTWTIKVENLDGFNTTDSVIFTIDLPIDYSTFTLRMVDVLKICIMLSGLFIIVMAAKSFFLGDSSFGRLFFICVVVGLAVLFILLLGPVLINYISTLIK